MCSFCQVKEPSSVGKWLVRGDCKSRRDPPSSQRDTCADNGFASSGGIWFPNAPAPFHRDICRAMDAAKRRESVVGEYKDRCDPASVCRDISTACLWVAELRRASPPDLRAALARVKKRRTPSNMSGLEDALGYGGEAPPDGTSLLFMTAQISGAGSQDEKVAMESVGRIRLSRAPHMKYKYLLSGGVRIIDKALGYFRRAAKQCGDPLVRAVASESEFICEAMRILSTPYAPPSIRPEGLIQKLAALRTLSRMVEDPAW